jgi:hypothetical protein
MAFLEGDNEWTRYLRLDRSYYPDRERDRRVLHRRLATRAHCQDTWTSAGAGRDGAGWVTLICGFALWPVALIWAYVDVPVARAKE